MTTSRTRRARGLAAAALVSTLALAACGSSDGESDADPAASSSSGITTIESGKLKACTHLSYKPFEFKEGSESSAHVELMNSCQGPRPRAGGRRLESRRSPRSRFAAKKCTPASAPRPSPRARRPSSSRTHMTPPPPDRKIPRAAPTSGPQGIARVQTDTPAGVRREGEGGQRFTPVVFDDLPTQLAGVISFE